MTYSLYAVLGSLPQIAVAAVLPIVAIVLVGYLIKTSRAPAGLD